MVTTANATALLVSWDALKVSYLSHYTIYYSAFSPLLNKVVDTRTKVILSTNTSEIVNIRELRAGVEHQFQVTASLEIDGEVYEKMIFMSAMLLFGKNYVYTWMHWNYIIACLSHILSPCKMTCKYYSFTDEAVFQLQIGPVTPCTTWSVSK